MSIRTEKKSLLEDPALSAMGLLPARDAADSNAAMLSWRAAWVVLTVGIVALIGLFWSTAVQIVDIWYDSKTFNHGFLILPIVGYLIWIKRGALANRLPSPSLWGVGVIFAGSLAWLLGELGSVGLVQQFALAIMVQGMFLAILGPSICRLLAFPLGYILFAVPFGEFMVAPLQDLTAVFVVKGLQLIGIPVYLDGIFISIPTGNFEVAEACSGVRFLIATIALGTLFAHLTYTSKTRKGLFIVLSLVVPIIANGFRAFGIVLLAYYTNNRLAVGVDHLVYGWIFFAFVTVVLLAIGMTFRDQLEADEEADPAIQRSLLDRVVGPRRIGAMVAVAVIAGSLAPAYAGVIASRAIDVVSGPVPIPGVAGGWRLLPESRHAWSPEFPGAHAKLLRTFAKDGKRVELFVAYYTTQRQGVELISVKNSIADGERWQRAASGKVTRQVDGAPLKIQHHRLLFRRNGRVAYHWYRVSGRNTGSATMAKILQAAGQLLGWPEAAAGMVISTTYDDTPAEADKTLDDFLANMESVSALLDRFSQHR